MPANILIDLNVILDVFLERAGFVASSNVIELGELSAYTVHISAHVVSTFAYLLENAKVPRLQILRHVEWLLQMFSIVATDKDLIAKALKSSIPDFEDALIEQAAAVSDCKVIVTRNIKDFKNSTIKALTPEEYLKTISV